uniref:Uncharacterized protein n=1 Tax=Arundo donax TaxID=35708 RepID=A0A0A9GTM8_ARUDO
MPLCLFCRYGPGAHPVARP